MSQGGECACEHERAHKDCSCPESVIICSGDTPCALDRPPPQRRTARASSRAAQQAAAAARARWRRRLRRYDRRGVPAGSLPSGRWRRHACAPQPPRRSSQPPRARTPCRPDAPASETPAGCQSSAAGHGFTESTLAGPGPLAACRAGRPSTHCPAPLQSRRCRSCLPGAAAPLPCARPPGHALQQRCEWQSKPACSIEGVMSGACTASSAKHTLPFVEGGYALVAVEARPGCVCIWRGRAICIWCRPWA